MDSQRQMSRRLGRCSSRCRDAQRSPTCAEQQGWPVPKGQRDRGQPPRQMNFPPNSLLPVQPLGHWQVQERRKGQPAWSLPTQGPWALDQSELGGAGKLF